MKKIDLESLPDGMKKIINLFYELLEKCHFELNQFVSGESLTIPSDISEILDDSLKDFLDSIVDEYRKSDNKDEFFNIFLSVGDYEKFDKFINWVEKYAIAKVKPLLEAEFLTNITIDEFEKMTDYCFENFVLMDIGDSNIDKEIWDVKSILIMKKVLYTFIDICVVGNYSKENAFSNMNRIFGLSKERCEIWWKLVESNSEKLWKILLMKKYTRIENKLDHLLECLEA
ncbi:MAG: hypothetical protein J6B50_12760 [Lachnospiraceae bacterium]|nr:hypothetical protein [Lachnospiraceae bacterium]